MTAEQATKNMRAFALQLREQEVRNLMAILGCDRERAEKLRVWLHNDEVVVGRLHRVERASKTLGERLAKAFERLATIGSRYRT